MGMLIFLTLVIVEISFAVYCIITKSNQQKIRNIMRIAAFMGFVLLTALTLIDWGFRYYAVAILLLLLAVLGSIALVRKKEAKSAYRRTRVVLRAIGMTVLIFVLTLPAIIFPQNKPVIETTGKYQVATANYTYTDANRIETYTDTGENRKLNVEIWYPENSEVKYPLVVFSHGGFGVKTSNESLYNELASHGYIVCSIDHTYQCLYTTDENGHRIWMDMDYMQKLSSHDAQHDKQQSYEYFQEWMKIRTSDIDLVIDYILAQAKNKDADAVYKLVDTSRIGVMGHSLGGSAALGIGRTRDDVNAVIALESPFMCDIEGVEDNEYIFNDEIYPVPVLNVYSDSSWSNLVEWAQYKENYALLSDTDATAFNVYISGAGHLTLTDLALTSPLLTRMLNGQKSTTDTKYCLKTINKICLEFFDSYLKGKGKFTSEGTY